MKPHPFYKGKVEILPECFDILDELRRTMDIPVRHDGRQGAATVCLAGILNAPKN